MIKRIYPSPVMFILRKAHIWQFIDYLAVFSLWVVDTVGKKNPS